MGLSRAAIGWLMEEHLRRPFEGTLLTLGVQNVFLNRDDFESLAGRMGVTLAPPPDDDREPLLPNTVTANHVFRRLGFDRVVTTDIDDFEGCDFIFDLNAPEVPPDHRGAYDMVLDAGTMEHVFHLPNGLANLLAFTRTGGRIVHQSPSSNHIDHGFWMFSPTLFHDYYAANGLEMPRFDIYRYRSTDPAATWDFATYDPPRLARRMFGGLGGGCFGIALVAEKTAEIAEPVIPQQSFYTAAWAGADGTATTPPPPSAWKRANKAVGAWFSNFLPEETRVRLRAARRGFPLPIRRRF